jgi:general secretion pathway protein N
VKNRWSWLALGVGAYLVFALSALPATTAVRWTVPAEMRLTGVQGTVWSGSAASATIRGIPVQDVRWRVHPWTLLTGRVGANVEARLADGFLNAEITTTTSRIQSDNLRAGMSLTTLALMVPAVKSTRGQASVTLSSIEIENGRVSNVRGELKLASIEVAPFIPNGSSNLLPLGNYTVTFGEAPQGSVAGRFVDNGGPLEVAGTLAVDAALQFTFDALIKPRAGAPQMLVDGLNQMAEDPDADGRRRLTFKGSL